MSPYPTVVNNHVIKDMIKAYFVVCLDKELTCRAAYSQEVELLKKVVLMNMSLNTVLLEQWTVFSLLIAKAKVFREFSLW